MEQSTPRKPVQVIIAKKKLTDEDADKLSGKFLTDSDYDIVIREDTDCYGTDGSLLFKFRKKVIPMRILKAGYEAFKGSIELTEGRGLASGSSHKRIRRDGSISNITVGNKVKSGNVGYMDPSAMIRYCRRTGFAKKYFEEFKQGIPFVEYVDSLYKELCPAHHKIQANIANGTNINYMIGNSSFTTVTVNQNFMTAVHKDSGDLPQGFGNLCIYRDGKYKGGYFCLPQYKIAIDLKNRDMLFVDVHKWHGNTPFNKVDEDALRIAFVMYYREYMYKCKTPEEELLSTKVQETGYWRL